MTQASRKNTVVIAPAYVNGTTVAQELGSKGAYVVAADFREKPIGFLSRFVREGVILPPPSEAPNAFAEWLFSRKDLYGALVVPTDDFHLRQVAEHYAELERLYRLAAAPPEATNIALNKDRCNAVVESLGHLVPKSVDLESAADLEGAMREVAFPAILKPVFGIAFQKDFKTKVFLVESEDDLRRDFRRASEAGHAVVLQEIIQGSDEDMAVVRGYANDEGRVPQFLTTIKRLSHPPHFGIGLISESYDVPEVVEPTRQLLEEIGYRGALFAAEWKRDVRDGKWRFIELNARSVMTIGVMKRAGVDAIDMMWRDKTGLPEKPLGKVRWGVRHTSVKNSLLRHAGYPETRLTFREYLRLYRPPISFDILRLDDLRPFLADLKPMFFRRFRKRTPETPSEPS